MRITLANRFRLGQCELAEQRNRLQLGLSASHRAVQAGRLDDLVPRLAPGAGWVPLRPRLYETIAVVHREDAVLSPGARLMIDLATERIRSVTDPVVGPIADPSAGPTGA